MLSPEATRRVGALPGPDEGQRELKFILPNGRTHLVRRWLASICRRDPEYPAAVVWTIYYDTPGLDSLGEKINSDYLKRKIRVRWYSDLNGQPSGPAFVEAKLRVGTRRSKVRVLLPYPAEEVAGWGWQDARWRSLPLLLQEHGIPVQDLWQPLMLIRYRRDRFSEPLSQSRVSLDADIVGVAANPTMLSAIDGTPLESAVLEVKGACDDLPRALHPVLQLGARQRSFSKFLAVYAHMAHRIL